MIGPIKVWFPYVWKAGLPFPFWYILSFLFYTPTNVLQAASWLGERLPWRQGTQTQVLPLLHPTYTVFALLSLLILQKVQLTTIRESCRSFSTSLFSFCHFVRIGLIRDVSRPKMRQIYREKDIMRAPLYPATFIAICHISCVWQPCVWGRLPQLKRDTLEQFSLTDVSYIMLLDKRKSCSLLIFVPRALFLHAYTLQIHDPMFRPILPCRLVPWQSKKFNSNRW